MLRGDVLCNHIGGHHHGTINVAHYLGPYNVADHLGSNSGADHLGSDFVAFV